MKTKRVSNRKIYHSKRLASLQGLTGKYCTIIAISGHEKIKTETQPKPSVCLHGLGLKSQADRKTRSARVIMSICIVFRNEVNPLSRADWFLNPLHFSQFASCKQQRHLTGMDWKLINISKSRQILSNSNFDPASCKQPPRLVLPQIARLMICTEEITRRMIGKSRDCPALVIRRFIGFDLFYCNLLTLLSLHDSKVSTSACAVDTKSNSCDRAAHEI